MGRAVQIAAIVAVIISAGLAVVFSSRFGRDPNLVPSPLIGREAPEFELPLIDGSGTASLTDFEGDIVVVNIFASWCPGCRTEHQALVSTAEAFADAGVKFVQIAYQDEPEDTIEFLEELGISPATTYLDDVDSRASIAFGVFGVPETYFIDAEGIVRGKIQGETNALLLGQTIDKLRQGEEIGSEVVGEVQTAPGGD
jgi:cytochrome c biogenesis protein CcmG/thiol:disulfide interchange protein DsbE